MMKLLAAAILAVAMVVSDLVRDLGGLSLVPYGAWLIYLPARFIVAGGLLIVGVPLLTLGCRTTG
jgi:hypothetical protein